MSIVLTILLWIFLGVLALILLVGILPLGIELELRKRDTWRYSAALRPFAGLGPRFLLTDQNRTSNAKTPKAAKRPKRPGKRRPTWRSDPMRVFDAGQRLLTGILRCIRIDMADIDMKVGFGDPADTGQAFGLMAPMIYGLEAVPRIRVQVEPMFGEATLRGRAELRLSVIPFLLLAPLLRFGWSVLGAKT